MHGQLFSQIMQKSSTPDNNNTSMAVQLHVKLEEGESLIEDLIPAPVLEEKQQQNDANLESPKFHQEQCSQSA